MPILQPIQTHQFRVLFGEDYEVLTGNMVSIQVDFVTRVLDLEVRDTIDNSTAKAMDSFLRNAHLIMWEMLDRSTNHRPIRAYSFSGLTLNEYTTFQDYSKAECVMMKVSLSFEDHEVDYS